MIIDRYIYCLQGCEDMKQPNCVSDCFPEPRPRGKRDSAVTIMDQYNFDQHRSKLEKRQ